MLAYHDQRSLNERYTSSIIYLKDDPIYIHQANEGKLAYSPLGPGLMVDRGVPKVPAKGWVETHDPMIRDMPFNLGYVNECPWKIYDDNDEPTEVMVASFSRRLPVRRWKQGLTEQNLNFTKNNLGFYGMLRHNGFKAMLEGVYPTQKKAFGLLGKKVKVVAYHRHWALKLNKMDMVELHYRDNTVGIGDDLDTMKLAKKFAWLQEAYELGVANGGKKD